MSQPTPYDRQANFSNEEALNPTTKTPGASLDAEYNAVKISLDQTQANLALIQRDDGRLANRSVGIDQLAPSLSIGFTLRGAWTAPENYVLGDGVTYDSGFWRAEASHVSELGSPPTPSNALWEFLYSVIDIVPVAIPDGSVTDEKLRNSAGASVIGRAANSTGVPADIAAATDGLVLVRKAGALAFDQVETAGLLDGCLSADVTGRAKMTDKFVTLAKMDDVATARIFGRVTPGPGAPEALTAGQALTVIGATSAGSAVLTAADAAAQRAALGVRVAVIGEIIRGQFTTPPLFCLWANGQNVSRTTYALLLDATTLVAPASSTTNASTTIAINFNGVFNLAEQVQVGMAIEGPGIQAGTTIAAISAFNPTFLTATLSLAANATGSPVSLRIFPSGNGNGTTTFGVADYRDRAGVARGNMGGTAAGRLTSGVSGINSSRLGVGGGDQNIASQNLSETFGTSNNAALNYVGQVPGDVLGTGGNPGGSIAAGTGVSGNVQPSIIENVAIFAGA
jgi:hypothetical protein